MNKIYQYTECTKHITAGSKKDVKFRININYTEDLSQIRLLNP